MNIFGTSLRERLMYFAGLFIGTIILYTIIYHWLLLTFEPGVHEKAYHDSLQKVVETLTTAGFGGDTDNWTTPQVNLFVVLMNLTGVALVFLGIPAFAVPLLQEAIKEQVPTSTDEADHVIICSEVPSGRVLWEHFESADMPYVFVHDDRETVRRLAQNEINVIHGDPTQLETLEAANIAEAKTLITDVDDQTNSSIILAAKQLEPEIEIISSVADSEIASQHQFAGADRVIKAKQILGESLASKATTFYAEELRDSIEVESEIDVLEVLVEPNSQLVGQSIRDAEVFGSGRLTVVGLWHNGRFVVTPHPSTTIRENMILLVVGDQGQIAEQQLDPVPAPRGEISSVAICGYGFVGQTVEAELERAGIDVTTIDIDPSLDTDVTGDVSKERTWDKINVDDIDAVVLVLSNDTAMIATALLLEELLPEVEVTARANDPNNIWKLYSAGAEYVLSLPTITGEIIADRVLPEEGLITPETGFEFGRITAPKLAGKTLREVDIRRQTNCTVVAVEREGKLITEVDPSMRIQEDDILVAVGDSSAIKKLREFTEQPPKSLMKE